MVLDRSCLRRQLDAAAYRIGDGKRIHLVKYVAWLVRQVETPPERLSEQEVRDRDLQRKNAARRAAQDIGVLPPVRNKRRRNRAAKSFEYFCRAYFPGVFYWPWSRDHPKVIALIERVTIHGGLFAFAMPRGSGKTVLVTVGSLWAILIGARRYVCLIGSAKKQSRNLMQSIQMALMTNDRLLEDFPEAVYPIRCLEGSGHKQKGQRYQGRLTYPVWGMEKIVFPTIPASLASGSVFTVDSLESNIRGQFHATPGGQVIRPDLVLVDDPQTIESAHSPTQTNQREEILSRDVLGLAGPGRKISCLMPCTKICLGDLSDRILNRDKNPEWQGQCTKMVYQFPANRKLWDENNRIRAEDLRAGGDGSRATAHYRRNRKAMDEGTQIAWPQRYNADEISAVQHAMNLLYRDEGAFFAEYQNEPLTEQTDEEVLKPDQVIERVNGRKQGEVPLRCQYVTCFIDVHDRLLYWLACGWEEDFTGYVIDYGTYPDQHRWQFTLRKAPVTLSRAFAGAGRDGAIQQGLEQLAGRLIQAEWPKAGGGLVKTDRCLIDSGYKPALVENVRHKFSGVVMASRGIPVRAANRPISSYQRKPGERYGHHWYIPNVARTREFPYVAIDANYWKTFVHERLMVALGDRGSLSLFGQQPNRHRLLADHLAGSEVWTKTQGHGRIVHEWKLRPNGPDNHWLDCLAGCAVGASMCGCGLPGMRPADRQERKSLKLSELQKRKSAF